MAQAATQQIVNAGWITYTVTSARLDTHCGALKPSLAAHQLLSEVRLPYKPQLCRQKPHNDGFTSRIRCLGNGIN
jgi:hypothetical protein